jgi:hypothetical protein
MTSAFARLGVPTALVDILDSKGITTPTPIPAGLPGRP